MFRLVQEDKQTRDRVGIIFRMSLQLFVALKPDAEVHLINES